MQIKNRGINGDTTIPVYHRLKRYIEDPKNKDTVLYILHVGTNDLLLPYLTKLSLAWKIQMGLKEKRKHCIVDDELFEQAYEKYFQLFEQHHSHYIIVGIPMCQLKGFPNERVKQRNEIIHRLADQYKAPFVDVCQIQYELTANCEANHTWKHKNLLRLFDGAVMTIFPFTKDWFSKARHLNLTVDGVHYNSLLAKRIGEAIQEKIRNIW